MRNLLIFMVAYFISIFILYFISVKIKLVQWIGKEKKRKFIALTITFAIYIIGTMMLESYGLNGNLRYMFRGILLAIFITPLMGSWVDEKKKRKK